MKKLIMSLFIGTMTLSLLTGCSEEKIASDDRNQEENVSAENSVAIFRGTIEEINNNTAIVKPNSDQEHILSSGDKVSVSLSVSDDEFSIGDEVVVYYTGEIMESYPLQIHVIRIETAKDFDEIMEEDNNSQSNSDIEVNELLPSAKIAINIEGIVSEINDHKITLDNGQIIIINDETAFETQNIGEIVPINDEILIGNYIQGFTLDDETASEVTALVISFNDVRNHSLIMNEIIINVTREFNGTLTEELSNLGVVSIEKIFDVSDTIMYLVKTEETNENIIEELEKMDDINYAEFNQSISLDPVRQ